jgi:hypothetical protein
MGSQKRRSSSGTQGVRRRSSLKLKEFMLTKIERLHYIAYTHLRKFLAVKPSGGFNHLNPPCLRACSRRCIPIGSAAACMVVLHRMLPVSKSGNAAAALSSSKTIDRTTGSDVDIILRIENCFFNCCPLKPAWPSKLSTCNPSPLLVSAKYSTVLLCFIQH